jgi:4-aminobutyrate aminotransferase-like enzyme
MAMSVPYFSRTFGKIFLLIYLLKISATFSQGETHHVVNPDPYRGVFGSDANHYAKDVQDHIDFGTSGKVAGFMAETIQVCVVFSPLE